MFLLAKYGTQTVFTFPMVKRGVVDLAATADWTPATGDTKISKDGGNVANSTNNPAAVGGTGSVSWTLTLTATELQAAVVDVQIVDSATKAVEDQFLKIYTYGHASARIQQDLSVDLVARIPSALVSGRIDASVGATAANVITATSIAADAITAAKVADGTIDAATFAAGAINAAAIADGAIDDAAVADDMNAYHAKVWMNKQSTTADKYGVVWFKNGQPVTSGITSPTIQVIKSSDGSDLIASTAMTQVGSLGIYKYEESTNKTTAGDMYWAKVTASIDSATRTWYQPVPRDSA